MKRRAKKKRKAARKAQKLIVIDPPWAKRFGSKEGIVHCTDALSLTLCLHSESIDAVITDPDWPYNSETSTRKEPQLCPRNGNHRTN
jgi:hypothetical protein